MPEQAPPFGFQSKEEYTALIASNFFSPEATEKLFAYLPREDEAVYQQIVTEVQAALSALFEPVTHIKLLPDMIQEGKRRCTLFSDVRNALYACGFDRTPDRQKKAELATKSEQLRQLCGPYYTGVLLQAMSYDVDE